MKYAWSPEMPGEHAKWTVTPWRARDFKIYDRVRDIPSDRILISSHFAPWWEPLSSWIREGRPWIEIEYGYWGPDTPRRETRRVTYNGHHNLKIKPVPYSRAGLFSTPAHQPWRSTPGEYVLAIQPVEVILQQRTGEDMQQFRERLTAAIRPYWSGEIRWRKKTGAKFTRFPSFQEQIAQAHAVVGERTMACTEACLLGVPGFTTDVSMSTLLLGGLENLSKPPQPNRDQWWEHICWSQFNRAEFDTTAPADLVEQYQIS